MLRAALRDLRALEERLDLDDELFRVPEERLFDLLLERLLLGALSICTVNR